MSGTCEWCGHDMCVCDDRPKAQEKDGIVVDLKERLAAAEQAARWCYGALRDCAAMDISETERYVEHRWPWLGYPEEKEETLSEMTEAPDYMQRYRAGIVTRSKHSN